VTRRGIEARFIDYEADFLTTRSSTGEIITKLNKLTNQIAITHF